MEHRSLTVGVLTPVTGGFFFGKILRGISRAVQRSGDRMLALQTLDASRYGRSGQSLRPLPYDLRVGWARIDGFISISTAVDRSYLEVVREAGKPVVLVTHEEKIAEHARRIIRVRDGHIVEDTRVARELDAREELAKFIGTRRCAACQGSRLRPEARHVFVDERSLPQHGRKRLRLDLQFIGVCQLDRRNRFVAQQLPQTRLDLFQFLSQLHLQPGLFHCQPIGERSWLLCRLDSQTLRHPCTSGLQELGLLRR